MFTFSNRRYDKRTGSPSAASFVQSPVPVPVTATAGELRAQHASLRLKRNPGVGIGNEVTAGAFRVQMSQYAHGDRIDREHLFPPPTDYGRRLFAKHFFAVVYVTNTSNVPQDMPTVLLVDQQGNVSAPVDSAPFARDQFPAFGRLNPRASSGGAVVFDTELERGRRYALVINGNPEAPIILEPE